MAPNANTGLTMTSRKSSAKEKRRRQLDAERVEKLRLLVSYLSCNQGVQQNHNHSQLMGLTNNKSITSLASLNHNIATTNKTNQKACDFYHYYHHQDNAIHDKDCTNNDSNNNNDKTNLKSIIYKPRGPIKSAVENISNNNNNDDKMQQREREQEQQEQEPKQQPVETSAWTHPQNLAAWIDNEVNSLVHDLEVRSRLVMKEKHAKSGGSKYKWLSGGCRRNLSGLD